MYQEVHKRILRRLKVFNSDAANNSVVEAVLMDAVELLRNTDSSSFERLLYHYKGVPKKVYDGDTVTHFLLDLGFRSHLDIAGRLYGIDTEEIRGGTDESKAEARRQRDVVKKLILEKEVYVFSQQDTTFNRWVVSIWFPHPLHGWQNLSDYLIKYENVKPYEENL